ncbi:MAG TPA: delta-60 repeat domain-containing protein, partial [Pseudobdellovibrionaceae bacterium]|nr:delta-60 repeat domain-containing protein [Pseudobdellovibrionaceae bacterium]
MGGLSACSKINPEVLAIFSKPTPGVNQPYEPEPRGTPVPDLLRLGVILDESGQPVVPASLMVPGRGLFEGSSVSRVAPAPDGGWFVSGVFNAYGGTPVSNLAKIRADGTLDVTWNLEIDGSVMELFSEGGRLYLSGEFSMVNGVRRNYLAAVNPATGRVVGPDFKLDGIVTALKSLPSGDLVIGGYFEKAQIDLSAASVAFDVSSGSRKPGYATVTTSFLSQVESDGADGFIVAGYFETFDGQPRRGLARIGSDGKLMPWAAALPAQANVSKMKRFDDVIYMAVSLASPIMGPSELWLTAVRISSGATLWSHKFAGGGFISGMEKIGDRLYVGGAFD